MSALRLSLLPGAFAVCRLPLDSALQMWFLADPFFAMLRDDHELTIVCAEEKVPAEVQHEASWRALKIEGVFGFTESGILESVLKPLADAGIGIFALSSFETDFVLVKVRKLQSARDALQAAGHSFG